MGENPPPPLLSPDGKFYYDGQRWLPMPSAPAEPPAPTSAYPWTAGPWGCVGVLLVIGLIIYLGFCGK